MNLFIKQQGQGKPLILLHGWGFNGEIWNPLATELAPNWRIYQVDLPGHGRSPLSEYTLPILTETLAAHLPQSAIWVGWSLGGLLAIAMARWRPAWVHKLVLVATSPRFVTATDWPHALSPVVLKQFAKQMQQDTTNTIQRFLALQVKGSDTAHQQLRSLNAWLKQSGIPQPAALQAGLQLLINTDLRSELVHIQSPALLCLGGRDTLVPARMGKDCQHWWPNLQQECISSAAHIPFLSHPDIFIPLLQSFLNNIANQTVSFQYD